MTNSLPEWVSEPRWSRYLEAARDAGNPTLAGDLYEWNSELGASILHATGHLEVALRNLYDDALQESKPVSCSHWVDFNNLFPPLLNRAGKDANDWMRKQVSDAVGKAGRGSPIPHFSLGFWLSLSLPVRREQWRLYLQPHMPREPTNPPPQRIRSQRAYVHSKVEPIHILRNRAAHWEPLLGNNIIYLQASMKDLAAYIHPSLSAHLAQHIQRIGEINAERPT